MSHYFIVEVDKDGIVWDDDTGIVKAQIKKYLVVNELEKTKTALTCKTSQGPVYQISTTDTKNTQWITYKSYVNCFNALRWMKNNCLSVKSKFHQKWK